ncbi:MAG: DUF2125 domain-containing protein [Rhodospirillaceae bacterium]|nr:MAG: DUF2125 domain-containing protein [Rhodospirillaceae bacterium]
MTNRTRDDANDNGTGATPTWRPPTWRPPTWRPKTGDLLGGGMALVVLYALAWLATAQILNRQVTQWIQIQRDNGLAISIGATVTGGFPGPVRVAARDVLVVAPITDGGWTWRTAKVRVVAWPLNFWHLTVDLSGRQGISGVVTPPGIPVWIAATGAALKLDLDSAGRLRTATLSTTGVSAAVAELPPVLRLQNGSISTTLIDPAPPSPGAPSPTLPVTSRITVDLSGLALPSSFPPPLDQPITHASATVEITGKIVTGVLPQVLNAWRADGGTVEVRAAALDWPPLHMAGSGTLALDDQLQPMGAFSLHFQGGGETLDALAKGGWIGDGEAGVAKLGLALMSQPGADGVTPELNVPLTLQDRRLTAGPATLMTMPEIVWAKVGVR